MLRFTAESNGAERSAPAGDGIAPGTSDAWKETNREAYIRLFPPGPRETIGPHQRQHITLPNGNVLGAKAGRAHPAGSTIRSAFVR
jgi:hypothetical protein